MRTIADRAPRPAALLLAAVLILSLLPIGALAAGDISVSDETALAQAVAGEYDTIRLSGDIRLTAPLVITRKLKLELDGHRLSAALDPDAVSDPLATVIVEEGAALTLRGRDGSLLSPPALPAEKTDKCYGIYVKERAGLTIAGEVKVKTDDDTSYMVFLLSDASLALKDKAEILGGMFGIKIPSGTEISALSISTRGSVSSGSAISKTGIPFSQIVPQDRRVTADGTALEDLNAAPDPSVSTYTFSEAEPPAPPEPPTPPDPPTPPGPPADPSDPPTDPPGPPVDPTDPPVDPTDPPVDPTDPPVDPTDPPVDPTDPPVDPTDPPVDPTDPPVNPTDPPVDPTDPPTPVVLPATTNMSWDDTRAMWQPVAGAEGYRVQLYLNGTDENSTRGEAVTVNGTIYDFAALMTDDGSYRFTVRAFAGTVEGTVSAHSRAYVVDKTPPKISSRAPVRHDAKRATFYFTSSEAGDYYFILTAADSAVPSSDSVIGSADVIHGACTAAEQAISLNRIADSSAKNIFLVVVDRAGNASNTYKITIPAYSESTPTPSPSPSPSPTPTPKPKTYTVSAPNGTGYSIVLVNNSKTQVQSGGSFSFTVSLYNGYTYGSGFSVKANNQTLTASKGVYTISNITSDQTVTVSGVVAATTAVPTAIPSGPSISTTLLPSATMGKSYSQQLSATGGTPITWSYTGSLPKGVTLTYGGLLSGTPTEEGTFRITIKASNSTGSATRQMTLVVTSADYAVTQGANASWTKGTGEGLTFQGSGESDFTVRVDGSVVPADMVTFSEDKHTVTIAPEYLDTLSAGSHTLTLLYSDGNAKARFNIKASERTAAPSITAQPRSTNALPGGDATFTVTSGGTAPLQCAWQVDKNDGAGWTDIPGADSASYTVKAVTEEQNGWKYRCVITNAAGSAESNAAVLTVGEETDPGMGPETPQKTKNTGRFILFSMLGVGVVGLGTGGYLFFRRKDDLYDDDDDE